MKTILITGGNSGIGAEFARQYSQLGWQVVSYARNPVESHGERVIPGVRYIRGSIAASEDRARLIDELHGTPVDILLNNAAAFGPEPHDKRNSFGDIDLEAWDEVFRTNVIGTFKFTESLMGNIRAGVEKKIIFISSRAGSIQERGRLSHHRPGGSYIYRTTKAALNAAVRAMAYDVSFEGIAIRLLHPGFIRTDMSNGEGCDDLPTNVRLMIQQIAQCTPEEQCRFTTFDGVDIPW